MCILATTMKQPSSFSLIWENTLEPPQMDFQPDKYRNPHEKRILWAFRCSLNVNGVCVVVYEGDGGWHSVWEVVWAVLYKPASSAETVFQQQFLSGKKKESASIQSGRLTLIPFYLDCAPFPELYFEPLSSALLSIR